MPYPSPHLKIARSSVQRGEVRPLIVYRKDEILTTIRASRWSKLKVVREVFLVLIVAWFYGFYFFLSYLIFLLLFFSFLWILLLFWVLLRFFWIRVGVHLVICRWTFRFLFSGILIFCWPVLRNVFRYFFIIRLSCSRIYSGTSSDSESLLISMGSAFIGAVRDGPALSLDWRSSERPIVVRSEWEADVL
ncbi:hypothetical protein PIB30_078341 [Stylosanthes scabra]|uniref:Uncharacterized protein n=1 Tax=Stylosanthes scabra TaxID=79078 RepID=A0ABU6WS06_9FABA|nr:hypothetical protein [Stylosanthes scabra]